VLIVMEYVEGEPLSRALRRGPLAAERVARMASELGQALDHAHRHGVVHRDVKPGNVLLRNDGVTKLVDLGIATAADHTRITRTGIVLGTASYMAPEQLEGRPAGPKADIYALAAVCFEALTGERARPGRSPMEIAHLVASEFGEGLRRALEERAQPTAATRRLEPPPGPAERRGEPVAAAAPRTPQRAMLGAPRRRDRARLLPLVLAGVLVAAAVAVVVIAFGSGGGDERASSPQAGGQRAERPAAKKPKAKKPKQEARSQPAAPQAAQPEQPAEQSAPAPDPEENDQGQTADESGAGASEGARLNDQGFRLMDQGRYDEAIPILQRAVNSFPPGTTDVNYAYALFNLGRSLRLAGRPDEAIPILEQRLQIPNQTGIVQRELDLARRDAARD
jgi:serine/threonine-protein kinase